MDEDQILDYETPSPVKYDLGFFLAWWERKRMIYNFIILGVQLFIIFIMWEETRLFGLMSAFWGSLGYLIVANLFYSIGWGLEIITLYYIGENDFLVSNRIFLFITGLLFSIFLTVFSYYGTLLMYQY